MRITYKRYAADFETTVYEGQTFTEVWAAALIPINEEAQPEVFNSIGSFFDRIFSLNENMIVYFHNLKFDGAFILSYFMTVLHWEQAAIYDTDGEFLEFKELKDMKDKTFRYSISDMGMWYSITLRYNKKVIEFRDSLKLIPLSVKQIGPAFGTQHRKTTIEYEGLRYSGNLIPEEEQEYIKNDVYVIEEALKTMIEEGHNRLTIGACGLAEFKTLIGGRKVFSEFFPQLYDIKIDKRYGTENLGEYIHEAYHGGWCYVKKGIEGKTFHHGLTADANSLYPSVMSMKSGNVYPYGLPKMFKKTIPAEALQPDRFYFVRIRTRFYLKEGHLPFIQLKGDMHYNGNEMLESSDVELNGEKCAFYTDFDGKVVPARVTMTLTQTDYDLIRDHYYLVDFEILDGCYFKAMAGLFDDYIEKYRLLKITAPTKGRRQISKLLLNSLYGKFAASKDSSYKLAYVDEDHVVRFRPIEEYKKEPGYIAVGAAVTSYARNTTIRLAQKNYKHFLYADTDSIHCSCNEEDLIDVPIDPKEFCYWKVESKWDFAMFVRQKTYVERVIEDDTGPVDPVYNLKCAGMPENCKDYLLTSITGKIYKEGEIITDEKEIEEYKNKLSKSAKEFISKKRDWSDFSVGLKVPGKLLPVRMRGGVVLQETDFEIRKGIRFI